MVSGSLAIHAEFSFTEQESTATLTKNIKAPGRMSERASNRISVHQIDLVMSKENSLAALFSGILETLPPESLCL
jgi:hypothetical protein